MSNSKVKGLLKGLRYISQIFDNEKEQEIQIGFPTDVKHVAHIGWDGPSVNSPSWMSEFKSSQPLNINGDKTNNQMNNSVKWASEETSRKASRSTTAHKKRELPDLPKTSRRQSTGSIADSPANEKSEKPKQPRKSSKPKDSSDGSKSSTRIPMDMPQGDSPAREIPKKSQRKKSKDENAPSRSRLKALATDLNSDHGSPAGSSSKFRNKQNSFDDDGGSEKEYLEKKRTITSY